MFTLTPLKIFSLIHSRVLISKTSLQLDVFFTCRCVYTCNHMGGGGGGGGGVVLLYAADYSIFLNTCPIFSCSGKILKTLAFLQAKVSEKISYC